MVKRTYDVWILAQPAPDVDGEWVAHALAFDVVSQGPSLDEAIANLQEAVSIVVLSDLSEGHDPLDRAAPPEEWDALWHVVEHGARGPRAELAREQPRSMFALHRVLHVATESEMQPVPARDPDLFVARESLAPIAC